ncbi:hypothetical protein PENSPDRAFT_403163 [Peniophora sp. CONT]|nr:hypothetical protein PENSPDRAFT_403163 [Peniophora sp. CONT]
MRRTLRLSTHLLVSVHLLSSTLFGIMRKSFPDDQWATLAAYSRLNGHMRDGGKGGSTFKTGLQDNFFEKHPNLLLPQMVQKGNEAAEGEGSESEGSERLETAGEVAQRVAKTKGRIQKWIVNHSHKYAGGNVAPVPSSAKAHAPLPSYLEFKSRPTVDVKRAPSALDLFRSECTVARDAINTAYKGAVESGKIDGGRSARQTFMNLEWQRAFLNSPENSAYEARSAEAKTAAASQRKELRASTEQSPGPADTTEEYVLP